MIYIIEGGEGTGKTTLANYLSKHTGFPIIHRSAPKTDDERRRMYKRYLESCINGEDEIWDRAFYSEMVYGPIMRDAAWIGPAAMYDLESQLAKKGAMLIHCTDDPVDSFYRAQQRGESYVTEMATHKKIIESFEKLMQKDHLIPVVTYVVKDFLRERDN